MATGGHLTDNLIRHRRELTCSAEQDKEEQDKVVKGHLCPLSFKHTFPLKVIYVLEFPLKVTYVFPYPALIFLFQRCSFALIGSG